MPATLIDGKALAATVRAALKDRIDAIAMRGPRPGLAAILAGDDPASRVYVQGVVATVSGSWEQPAEAWLTRDSFGDTAYDARHVLPFLADLFASVPRRWSVGWIGGRPDTFRMFCQVWSRFGGGRVVMARWASPLLAGVAAPGVVRKAEDQLAAGALKIDDDEFGRRRHDRDVVARTARREERAERRESERTHRHLRDDART